MQAVKMYTTAVCPYCQQAKQLRMLENHDAAPTV
jgi:glutaredoxin